MNSIRDPLISIHLEELLHKDVAFKEKFADALRHGIFYVKIPEACEGYLEAAKSFAETLRSKEEQLKSFNTEPFIGYQVRQGTQQVSFVAKKMQWTNAYSEDIQYLAEAMNTLALDILKEALSHLAIPPNTWDEATGGLTRGEGTIVFSVNHYQPGPEKQGLFPHTDMGWITVLFINQLGLKAKIEGEWTSIPPKEGYFVVNFGKAFEILLNDPSKLSATLHAVDQVAAERISFGLFINHAEGTHLYQKTESGKLEKKQTYAEYLNSRFAEFQSLQLEYAGK